VLYLLARADIHSSLPLESINLLFAKVVLRSLASLRCNWSSFYQLFSSSPGRSTTFTPVDLSCSGKEYA
jgi:hypothetical protein